MSTIAPPSPSTAPSPARGSPTLQAPAWATLHGGFHAQKKGTLVLKDGRLVFTTITGERLFDVPFDSSAVEFARLDRNKAINVTAHDAKYYVTLINFRVHFAVVPKPVTAFMARERIAPWKRAFPAR